MAQSVSPSNGSSTLMSATNPPLPSANSPAPSSSASERDSIKKTLGNGQPVNSKTYGSGQQDGSGQASGTDQPNGSSQSNDNNQNDNNDGPNKLPKFPKPSNNEKPGGSTTRPSTTTPTQHDYQDVYMNNRNNNMNPDQAREAANKSFQQQYPYADVNQLHHYATASEAKKQVDDALVKTAQKEFNEKFSDALGKGAGTDDALKQADADVAQKNPGLTATWRQRLADAAKGTQAIADAATAAARSASGGNSAAAAADAAANAGGRLLSRAAGVTGVVGNAGLSIGLDAKDYADAMHSGDQQRIEDSRNTLIADVSTLGFHSLFHGIFDAGGIADGVFNGPTRAAEYWNSRPHSSSGGAQDGGVP